MLTAARANIIGDLNLWTCAQLLRRTGSPENLRIVLHPRMVHGKAIVGDGAWVDIGSTNFTSPSHGGYEEVDLFCRDAAFAKQVEDAIEHDIRDGKLAKPADPLPPPVCGGRANARAHSTGARRSRRSKGASRQWRERRGRAESGAGHRADRPAAAAGALLAPSAASAWQVADPIHHDCHERISAAALDPGPITCKTPPPADSGDDAALRDGLQFDAAPYPANIYALSLIIGTRWPDSQGEPSFDFYKLSNVHNAPGDQGSHCLREESDVGAEPGDTHALAGLPRTITTLYWQALATLDPATGAVDPDERTLQPEYLPFLGKTRIPAVGLLLLRGARGARNPGQLHPHLPAHGRRRRRPQNHVGLQLVVPGARRSGRGGERPRPRDDPRRLPGRQPDNADRMGWATEATAELLAALTTPGERHERQMRLDAFFTDWMGYEAGLLNRERVLRQPRAGLAARRAASR